jgi:hypothetical protein
MVKRIRTLKLAFIYTQTMPGLLTGTLPGPAPLPFLASGKDYAVAYEGVRAKMQALSAEIDALPIAERKQARQLRQQALSTSGTLTPPWPWLFLSDNYEHRFWQYYLGNRPNLVPGGTLWETATPFQLNLPARIVPEVPIPWLKKLVPELFVYPHGLALILQATLRFNAAQVSPADSEDVSLRDTAELVIALRSTMSFNSEINGQTNEPLKLGALAQRLLDAARETAFGKGVLPEADTDSTPLSVATVLQASGVDENEFIASQGLLHQMLEALCDYSRGNGWNNADQIGKLVPLHEADLLVNKATHPTDERRAIGYHLKRGRATWVPKYYNLSLEPRRQSLSCYHRNLTLVFMQAEMLRRAIWLYLKQGDAPTPELAAFAQQAGNQLRKLYGLLRDELKNTLTYNSSTPRAYLDENGYTPIVNLGLQKLGLPELVQPGKG